MMEGKTSLVDTRW